MGISKRKKQVKQLKLSDYDYTTKLVKDVDDETGKLKKKKFDRKNLITAFDLMQSETVQSRDQLFDLCDIIINGRAVLANFEKLSKEDANYMLTFISGVVYALDGEVHKTSLKTFLFARKEQFEDETLHQFIEDIK